MDWGGEVQHSLLLGKFHLGWWAPVNLGIRKTWVLTSSLPLITCEIVIHSNRPDTGGKNYRTYS